MCLVYSILSSSFFFLWQRKASVGYPTFLPYGVVLALVETT